MAYVNEEADGREFVLPLWGKITPHSWTRNSEKDTILFGHRVDREFMDRMYFGFQYKGHVMNVILEGNGFVGGNTKRWKLIRIDVPEELSRIEVLAELRQAIVTFGCNGSCYERLPAGRGIADF